MVKRKPSKGFKRAVETLDRRELERTLGRWHVFEAAVTLDTSKDDKVVLEIPMPWGAGTPDVRGIEIYGMDSLITLLATGSAGNAITLGVMTATKVKGATPIASVPDPGTAATANEWPWRFWVMWALTNQGTGVLNKMMNIPFSFFRGRRLTLMEDEKFYLIFSRLNTDQNVGAVSVHWTGRYRFIPKNQVQTQ